jgi:ATP-dependent DNA helicase RecG
MTIQELLRLKESEDKVEFKEAKSGNFHYNGGNRIEPKDRRKCILGYIVALANERGGHLVLGITDKYPHLIVGTNQSLGSIGKLEQDIYDDLKIRVLIKELFDEKGLRVLHIQVPSRPTGKVFNFEDIPLMRVGDELLKMTDEQYRNIINEQEPDFTNKVCEGLTINDLDLNAIEQMKKLYVRKQDNTQFFTLPIEQILSDLNLTNEHYLKYAALILLGKESTIEKYLPQSEIRLEYRNNPSQISFDDRFIIHKPYFLMIDEIWERINLRNGKVPVQEGPFIFDISFFNREVIREGINNAIAHRDYSKQGEILIKQSPQELSINSPGGFPLGVTLENLLTVNSTPRNRLLADVLAKTGAVERSGQGVDKMFYQCLTEAKNPPDYSTSDDYQVNVILSAIVKDKAFAIFIKDYQENRTEEDKLSVHEIIILDKIREGNKNEKFNNKLIQRIYENGLIEKIGNTRNLTYRLTKQYYSFIGKEGLYTKESPIDLIQAQLSIINHLKEFESAKMKDFVELFTPSLSRDQIKYIIYKFTENGILDRNGKGYKAVYHIGKNFERDIQFFGKVIATGIEELKKRGEIQEKKI